MIVFGATAIESHLLLILLLQEDCSHMMLAIESEILCRWHWSLPFLIFFGQQFLSYLLLLSLSEEIILDRSKRTLLILVALISSILFIVIVRCPFSALNDKMQQKLMLLLCKLLVDHLHQSLEEFFLLVVFFYLFLSLKARHVSQ